MSKNLRKYCKSAMLGLFLCLVGFTLKGQSDQDLISALTEKLNAYVNSYPREEVYMHTDRQEYIAGEELYFSVYIIDRRNLEPSRISSIAYIELISDEGVPVVQQRVLAKNALGSGNFILSDSLHTGTYTLRAYTSWMRNFLPSNCYEKEIVIYNMLADENHSVSRKQYYHYEPLQVTSGLKFNVDRTDNDTIKLTLTGDSSHISGRRFFTIIQTHGKINYTGVSQTPGNELSISVPRFEMSEGVNHITVFNESGKVVGEKLIYTSLPGENDLSLNLSRNYKRREWVESVLHTDQFVSDSSVISISVSPGIDQSCSIEDYMNLGTEFGLKPEFVFRQMKPEKTSEQFMDSLLANAKNSWIDWNMITAGMKPEIRYLTEKDSYHISGSTSTNYQDLVFLTSPGKNAWFQYAIPDSAGKFRFTVRVDEGLTDFVIVPETTTEENHISIESSFADNIKEKPGLPGIQTAIPEYISKWSINYQVRKLYETSGINGTMIPTKISTVIRFYGKPDHELVLADYISLPLMEEVFFEILPNVSIRKRGSEKEIIITDRVDNKPYTLKPTLMIDGVIIKDPNLIIDLDPEHVEKIEVVKEKYIVGRYVFPGIVNVITKKGAFIEENKGFMRFKLNFTADGKSLSGPDYKGSVNETRIPDYRTTLLWKHGIKTDSNGQVKINFLTSDNPSGYTMRIEGISSGGKMISVKQTFTVD